MADAHLRHRGAEEEVSDACQQLVEIDHQVNVAGLDALVQHPHAAGKLSHPQHVVGHAARQAAPLVGRGGQEVGAVEAAHRGFHAPREECGQLPGTALSHQGAHHLVAFAAQQGFHREGLRKVSAALALHNE